MNRRSLLAAVFAAPLTFVGAVRGWRAGGERVPEIEDSEPAFEAPYSIPVFINEGELPSALAPESFETQWYRAYCRGPTVYRGPQTKPYVKYQP